MTKNVKKRIQQSFKYAMILSLASCKVYFVKRDAYAMDEKLDQKMKQLQSIQNFNDLDEGLIDTCKPIAYEIKDDFQLWLTVSRRYISTTTKERIQRIM